MSTPTFANAGFRAAHEPSSAELAHEWSSTVAGWLARIDFDDLSEELFDKRAEFQAAVESGDAARIGALVLSTRQALAERLAARWADDFGVVRRAA